MALDKVTITGVTGPGNQVTGLVINDVKEVRFEFDRVIIAISYGEPRKTMYFSYTPTTSVVFSISGGVTTVTIS